MGELSQKIAARVIFYSQTLAQWTSSNPVIPQSEIVKEIGIGTPVVILQKTGNGTDRYLDLPYDFTGGAGGSGNLQNVLNAGHIASTAGGGIADIKLISPSPTLSVEITGAAIGYLNTADGSNGNYDYQDFSLDDGSGNTLEGAPAQLSMTGSGGSANITQEGIATNTTAAGGLLSFVSSAVAWFKNSTNQIVAQIANVAGRGEVWLRIASADKRSKIVPTSTSDEVFSLPDKAGAGGTFAMTSDIPASHPTGSPTAVAGAGLGTGGVVNVNSGDDKCGIVSMQVGTSPSGSGATYATVTFHTAYPAGTYTVLIIPYIYPLTNANGMPTTSSIVGSCTNAHFVLSVGGVPAPITGDTFIFQYLIIPAL